MRILLVTGTLPPEPCGVGDYTAKLANALADHCEQDIAILSSGVATFGQSIGDVCRIVGPKNWQLREAGTVWAAIKTFRADIVHLQIPSQGFRHGRLPDFIPAIAWSAGAAVVRTWHEPPGIRGLLPLAVQTLVPGETIVVRKDFLRKVPASLGKLLEHRCTFIPGASAIPRAQLTPGERHDVRQRYLTREGRLIVFFGFLYPAKGAEVVFDIADATRDTLIFAGPADEYDSYTRMIVDHCGSDHWAGHARLVGMLQPADAAHLLAAADAVVLPFIAGGGSWNTSIHAAVQQGTPVITTSLTERGLDADAMVDYSTPGDVIAMRAALNRLASQRRKASHRFDRDGWEVISRRHMSVYRTAMSKRRGH